MTFVDTVLHDERLTLRLEQVEAFEAALRYSIKSDPYTTPDFSPFGFEQRQLYELRVLLLRPLAFQFALELDRTIRKTSFDKKTTIERYEHSYQRLPNLISLKPRIMCLTYAEWIGLALPQIMPLQLPEELRT